MGGEEGGTGKEEVAEEEFSEGEEVVGEVGVEGWGVRIPSQGLASDSKVVVGEGGGGSGLERGYGGRLGARWRVAYIMAFRNLSSIKAWTTFCPAGFNGFGTFHKRMFTVWSAVFLLLGSGTMYFFS